MDRPLHRVFLLAAVLLAVLAAGCKQDPPPTPVDQGPPPPPPQTAGLTSRPPDAELLDVARALLGEELAASHCGPYALWTDVVEPRLLAACDRLADRLDAVLADRYRIKASGEPAEAILLFAHLEDYRAFARRAGVSLGYAGFALGVKGLAAFHADDTALDTFLSTLTHELTHLVLRRALGAKTPPWLSEGLATEIGLSAREGGFLPLGGIPVGVRAKRLREAHAAGRVGRIERLVGLEREEFDREIVSYDYEQSALVVRFLLEEQRFGNLFRGYLQALMERPADSPEKLREALDVSWDELDERFEAWLEGMS